MNSFDDLHDEFGRLAGDTPDDGALRSAVATGLARRERRRRSTALIAVAASVTLVVGGVGVTRALTAPAPNSTRPAAPSAVVAVPDVPLSSDTQLIRHQLQPVVSPVSATPPEGLTASAWITMPGRLAVWWYRSDDPSGGILNGSELRVAGYVVTDGADDPLTAFDGSGLSVATVDSEPITVSGHDAMLQLSSADAIDKTGMPATQRISWQLADGRYVHVFVNAAPSKDGAADPTLLAFAESIAEEPTTLIRTIGVGLTLPGLTEDVSTNVPEVGFGTGGSVLLCPEGVDPYASFGSSSSGEGAASSSTVPPPDAVTGSASAGPGETTTEITPDPENPLTSCITVFVIATAALDSNSLPAGTPLTAAGTTVQVDTANNAARVDLSSGLLAVVAAPPATPLSAEDLAALAASVRLSPDVTIADSGEYSAAMASSYAETASSSEAATAAPDDPALSSPIVLDGTAGVTISQEDDGAATVEFTLENISSSTPDLTTVELIAPGFTQQNVQVRLDNLPSDAGNEFQDGMLPAMLAPHTRIRVRVELRSGECSEAGSAGSTTNTGLTEPQLHLEWEGGTTSGFSSSGGAMVPLRAASADGTQSGGLLLGGGC